MVSVVPALRSLAWVSLAVGALAGAACSDGTGPRPQVASLEVVGGVNQSAGVNAPLPVKISIRALSMSRDPISDVFISFWLTNAVSGKVEPGFARTNGDGVATATWTLGASPGIQTLEACTNLLILPVVCTSVTATATE